MLLLTPHLREMIYKAGHESNGLQRYVARRYLFGIAEWAGFHVLGDHFYEPIPNLRELASSYDESPREIFGHPIQIEDFEAAHVERVERYGTEFVQAVREQNYNFANFYFGPTDALSYYALLRERKPSAVIEIGQGMSTRIAVAALKKNAQETGCVPTMLSIDPYSRLLGAELKPQAIDFNVTAQRIQDVPAALVLDLCGPSTFLFVDSSHVYKAGSDVWYLTHQIYPHLPIGTFLHIHDILLPYPWLRAFYVQNKWFWNEQEMLEQFLAFNEKYRVRLPVFWLGRQSLMLRKTLEQIPPKPSTFQDGYSFYVERVA